MPKLDDELRRRMQRAGRRVRTDGLEARLHARRAHKQITQKVGRGFLAVAVLAGSAVGVAGLNRAFRGEGGTPTDSSVSASPSLIPPSAASEGEHRIPGVSTPACDVSRASGDLWGSGIEDVVFVFAPAAASGCTDEEYVLAITLDSAVVERTLSIDCTQACRVFALPDLDGDRRQEIAVSVGLTAGSTLFRLFRVDPTTGDISQVKFLCTDCNEGTFSWGGNEGHREGIDCSTGRTDVSFVSWNAERKDTGMFGVHESFIEMDGNDLREVDERSFDVPEAQLPPGAKADFCGAPVLGPTP